MRYLWPSFRLLVALSLLLGFAYPLVVTLMGQVIFPHQANGSLVKRDGRILGSELIGQKFSGANYFWPRPSSTEFATIPSGGSNLGPTSAALKKQVDERAAKWRSTLGETQTEIPSDLLFSSASGLDPDISLEAALIQVPRIASTRNLSAAHLTSLISHVAESPQWGLFGEARVNVLRLNLALDAERVSP